MQAKPKKIAPLRASNNSLEDSTSLNTDIQMKEETGMNIEDFIRDPTS